MGGICPAGDLPLKADLPLKGIAPLRRFLSISAPSPRARAGRRRRLGKAPRENTPGTFVMGRTPYGTQGEPPRAKMGCFPGLTRPLAAPRPAPSRPPPREEKRAFRPPPALPLPPGQPPPGKPREGKQPPVRPGPSRPRSWPFPGPFRSPPSLTLPVPAPRQTGTKKGAAFATPCAAPRLARKGGPYCP